MYQVSFKICERAEKGKNERSFMALSKVTLKNQGRPIKLLHSNS
jgi:hypothetical protein